MPSVSVPRARDPLKFIEQNPEIFFGTAAVEGWRMAAALAEDALVLGVSSVRVIRREDGWTSVVAAQDWTLKGSGSDSPADYLFKWMVPFDELGPNAVRSEAIAAALCSDLFIVRRGDVLRIKGSVNAAVAKAAAQSPFSMNFRMKDGA